MTRASLNRTLRRVYVVLGLVLAISIAAKFADRIPGIAGTPLERAAGDIYDYLRDMALVLVTVVAAYLANVFQKRSKFVERLEEEWRGIVRTKSALYTFCEKQDASSDDYLAAFCRISETIDNMRVVYSNVGETDELVGLYPFAPLHDMRRALQSIDPRKRADVSPEEKKARARCHPAVLLCACGRTSWRSSTSTSPTIRWPPLGARRLKQPGVTRRGRKSGKPPNHRL